MMKMTGNASSIDDSTRACWLMAGVVVVLALFWETRALVSVQIVEVPAERVLHMAETGTIRWARIGGGTLMGWSSFWIGLGLAFAVFICFGYERHWLGLGLTPDLMTVAPQTVEGVGLVYNDGTSATVKYITGYLVEKSLAVDNIW